MEDFSHRFYRLTLSSLSRHFTCGIMQLLFVFFACLAIAALSVAQEAIPISFGFSHILDGISPADCSDSNYASCSATIQQTVATTISVDQASVQHVSFYAVPAAGGRFLQGSSQTTVSYIVSTESATETYDSLTTTLTTAINSNAFTTTMQGLGSANALATATALSEANGGQLTATNRLVARSASSKLTGTQIAGLVIGIILFLVLLAVLIAFALQAKSSEAAYIANSAKPVSSKETA